MNRLLKTLLLWLLIAVLPLHAVATTMSASCGPIHHQAMQGVLSSSNHYDDVEASHLQQEREADTANFTTDTSSDETPSGESSKYSTCSACSASCVGASAPPSASKLPPAFNGAESVIVAAAPLVTGFIPAGLERPPRHIP